MAIADSLGLQTILDGIEQSDQRSRLSDVHCESDQGFLFSKPLPLTNWSA
jgi:EAL domain-containing protein (putative c-di-GMP-specific phosphodiesterase class I)